LHTESLKMKMFSRMNARRGAGRPRKSPYLPLAVRSVAFVAVFLVTLSLLSLSAFPQEDSGTGKVMVRMAHLSPDAPKGDVYINDEPVGSLQDVPFGTISSYQPLPGGTQDVKLYQAGDDPETSKPTLEVNADFEGGDSYTLAVVGLVGDGSLSAKLYEDDNSPPSEGKTKMRVVHAVPDVGAATVSEQGGEDLFDLPGFSNASDYAEVPAGTHTLEVKPAGSDEAALSIPNVDLSAGEVYTVFAAGRAADSSLGAVLTADREGDSTTIGRYGGLRDDTEPLAEASQTPDLNQNFGLGSASTPTPVTNLTVPGPLAALSQELPAPIPGSLVNRPSSTPAPATLDEQLPSSTPALATVDEQPLSSTLAPATVIDQLPSSAPAPDMVDNQSAAGVPAPDMVDDQSSGVAPVPTSLNERAPVQEIPAVAPSVVSPSVPESVVPSVVSPSVPDPVVPSVEAPVSDVPSGAINTVQDNLPLDASKILPTTGAAVQDNLPLDASKVLPTGGSTLAKNMSLGGADIGSVGQLGKTLGHFKGGGVKLPGVAHDTPLDLAHGGGNTHGVLDRSVGNGNNNGPIHGVLSKL
jgi:hypothetical protein